MKNHLADITLASYLHVIVTSAPDTIAAISTAPGAAGISIIRLSGPASLAIADTIFRGTGEFPSNRSTGTFLHGFIRSPEADNVTDADEVILLIYRTPNSYTREDVVEIQGHGGRACARRILRIVLAAGARPAEPGEFTKRAFLNGRIDLLQAEAIADLIMAGSDRAAAAAIEQLEGSLSSSISAVYTNLINAAADLEASLDFPEEDLPASLLEGAVAEILTAQKALTALLGTWEEGHLLREGALVVISGRPNVGKSTLLNALLGTNRAIVTPEPGTTRDSIEEIFVLDGVPLRLVDTAGIRESDNIVEQEGIHRARALIAKADLNLLMLDASAQLDESDICEIKSMDPSKSVLILNKVDLGLNLRDRPLEAGFKIVECCLVSGQGLEDVKNAIAGKLGIKDYGIPHATISERHRHIVQNVLAILNDTVQILSPKNEDLLVPAISTLRAAIEELGTIMGQNYDNNLLDNIFKRFCVGK